MRGRWILALVVACGGGGDDAPAVTPTPVADAGDAGVEAGIDLCPGGRPVEYPPGPYGLEVLQTVPRDLVFQGPAGAVHVADRFEPCATRSRLVVIRTSGAWCGSCQWHATHTQRLLGDFAERVLLVDLLVSDEDNMPADAAAATRWRARVDFPGEIGIDTSYSFAPALGAKFPLPSYIFVDTRTMRIVNAFGDQPPEQLQNKLLLEFADLDQAPFPKLSVPKLYDGFTEDQRDLIAGMALSGAPPAEPSNAFGDSADAAALGKKLFSDLGLSPSGTVSCATCHDPTKHLSDGVPQAIGVAHGDRNSPMIALASFARWQFWDGRADALWTQAVQPFENAREIASNRLFIAHQLSRYPEYATIFGALPDFSALPANGKPGDAAWDGMSAADKDAVTRAFVNVGKSIAAFERTLRVSPAPIDRYAGGDLSALSDTQKKALSSYFTSGCAQCHFGPRLTNDSFHVLRFPTGRVDGAADRGRADVLLGLATAEFSANSKWSDSTTGAKNLSFTSVPPSMIGAFKTPSLRGVAATAPYGHGGIFTTPLEVSHHYGVRGQDVGNDKAAGEIETWVPMFDSNAEKQLPAVFDIFTSDVVVP